MNSLFLMFQKARNTKNKRIVLNKMLEEKNIPHTVEYRWGYKSGWYLVGTHDRIGDCFFSARSLIDNGVLDFLAEK